MARKKSLGHVLILICLAEKGDHRRDTGDQSVQAGSGFGKRPGLGCSRARTGYEFICRAKAATEIDEPSSKGALLDISNHTAAQHTTA